MKSPVHAQAAKVAQSALDLGLALEIIEFDQTTHTAEEAASAIGCQVGQIVKSLLFLVNKKPVMALISGGNRLDEDKLAGLCDANRKQVKRADADLVKEITGFTIGGVPPFGHTSIFPLFLDEELMAFGQVWAAAGTPRAVFAIAPATLAQLSKATISNLKV
ncbi:MAG TPA: YbaK/EbsC family protein [Patescibacteria group bacterium]|jgi:prolyl-tRNA editing enzyme YbaK/EbsC (Cys-tRNA(Pro) deacylase)|nr:YbaK/EbsC family protein [Patescibacteria group bacterium]